MKLSEKQKELLSRIKFVVFSTSSNLNQPRSTIVQVSKAEDDRIIITDNEMRITRENLLKNDKVFILAFEKDYSYCLKISGKAEYETSGKCFDFVKSLEANKGFYPKGVIIVHIENIEEFK